MNRLWSWDGTNSFLSNLLRYKRRRRKKPRRPERHHQAVVQANDKRPPVAAGSPVHQGIHGAAQPGGVAHLQEIASTAWAPG